MLILKYFVVVGALLMAGLLALNARLDPNGTAGASRAATTASLPVVPPPAPSVKEEPVVEVTPLATLPKKEPSTSRRSSRSAHHPSQRRAY
jgi:hypothetical protein